ncbi:SusD/RagB family nutrient-binding outer membrane lipoprotein [Parafilimonas sp.]|uniref:SusD/RagB family nutrient-binding outer membrane lipoprotein n=1 Tax=Parafilimonas sp. TaxID=1969739 RepID=UPI0039E332E0
MKQLIYNISVFILLAGLFVSCKKLDDVNINPNGVQEDQVNPNLIMPTVLSEAAKLYNDIGYQDLAGVVQHTQKDAWFTSHNDYDWDNSQSWSDYYAILRNNKLLLERAAANDMQFHIGVGLVMKSFMFGLIADLWGAAPYSDALRGDEGDSAYLTPKYDSQEDIYLGILSDLDSANTLLSLSASEYSGIDADADLYYGGDPDGWRRFANSLALRYYMRLSAKEPAVAQAGVEKIANDPDTYPIITDESEDAAMPYVGSTSDDSWPYNSVNYDASGSYYRRIKMCSTLVDALELRDDPRLAVWANKVQIPLVVDASLAAGTDTIIDGKRYLAPDVVEGVDIDTDQNYVGIPPAYSSVPSSYNLNPTPGQTSYNPHVSFLNDIYTEASGDLLKARLLSAAEVNFILAEAAADGWSVDGTAESYYDNGIKQSLVAWGVDDDYDDYIAGANVAFDGTVEQIITQKWIATWTAAAEAWFDYRRTGYPAFTVGEAAIRSAMPLRFYYSSDEQSLNATNVQAAMDDLETTSYSESDGSNSAWSKFWLLQGTGEPY